MGAAVFSGMIGVTLFGLLLTPVFYVLVRRAAKSSRAGAAGSRYCRGSWSCLSSRSLACC